MEYLLIVLLRSLFKIMSKIIGWILVLIIIVGGIVMFTGKSDRAQTGPIKIGFIGPLTGDASNIGQNAKAAVEIAVDEINANGGIGGQNVEVIYEDGKCTGATASSAANKLINVDKVSVILGGACSGETSAFTNLAEQSKTTVLSYCSSAPAITNAGDYIFRNYPSDNYQGVFAAEYLKNTLGKSKAAILFVKSDWGVGLQDVFSKKFTELGGTVAVSEGYEQTSRDLRSNISKIKASNPDVIYFLGYTEASIPGLKQLAEAGIQATIFGGDAWDDAKIYSDAGKASEGIMFTVGSSNPTDEFKAKMKAKVGSDEFAVCTPTAYDGMNILTQVIKKVGTDSTLIKNELYKTKYTGGMSSSEISFDVNGDPLRANYVVKTVKDGKAEIVK